MTWTWSGVFSPGLPAECHQLSLCANLLHAMDAKPLAAGFPTGCVLIELHLSELQQLFNSLDPTPFRERDLDAQAEEFIADWARDVALDAPLGLMIHVDGPAPAE